MARFASSTRAKPDNLPLEEILGLIDTGRIALPDFQRDFDWTERDVQALLVTVLTGWPIGSLLLLEGRPGYLELRELEYGPPIAPGDELEYVVLDGQQRLTALYQALYGRGPYIYAVDLSVLGDGSVDELEEAVRHFNQAEWRLRLGDPETQLSKGLLPIAALKSAADFFAWRDEATATMPSEDQFHQRELLTDTYRRVLSGVHRYQIPAVLLPSRIAPRAVARIFERVNRTGMRLEAFDLVVARSFTASWNLRRRYEQARVTYPLINAFLGKNGMPLLQAISLRLRSNVRESAVIDIPGEEVRHSWDVAVASTDQALRFLIKQGVVRPDFLPYSSILVVLSALAFDQDLESHADRLSDWYWGTVFTQSYDVASNTRSVADYKVLAGRSDGELHFRNRPIVRNTLREATRRSNGALWRAFLCLLARSDPRSLETNEPLIELDDIDSVLEDSIEAFTLFARATAPSAETPPHLRALSYVLGGPGAARRIGAGILFDAIAGQEPGLGYATDALSSQFLPTVSSVDYSSLDWTELIDLRLSFVEPVISELTSAPIVEYEPLDVS